MGNTHGVFAGTPQRRRNSAGRLLLIAASILCVIWQASQNSLAAIYTYTPSTSTTDQWSLGTNWSATPVSASTTELTFVANNATVLSNNLANTSTDDIAVAFSLNILDLQGTGPASGSVSITINSSSSSNYLNFVNNGATAPVVNLNALWGTSGLQYGVTSKIALADNTTFQGNGTAAFYLTGVISGSGGLTKSGTSTLMLGGSNTYSGLTAIKGGTLVLHNGNALSNSTLDYNNYGGSLSFGMILQAVALGGLQGNQDLMLGSLMTASNIALTVGANNSSGTYSGVLNDLTMLGGVGSLSKQGSGTLTLAGANTYRGSTSVLGGAIRLSGGENRLPTTTTVTLANSPDVMLDLNGQNQTIASLTGGGASGGNLALGSARLTVGDSNSTTYAGVISGANGGLIKQGSGTLTLSGANTYTGPTTINVGVIRLSGGSDRLPAATAVTLANKLGVMLDLNGQNETIAALSGGGGNGGKLALGSARLTVGDSSNTIYASIISGSNGSLVKQGSGTLTLSGANTYTGSTTINAGTVRLSGGWNPLPTTTVVSFADIAGATLDINGQVQTIASLNGGGVNGGNVALGSGTLSVGGGTYSGRITGTGTFVLAGGTLVLSGLSTYAGSTMINNGTLRLSGADNVLPVGAAVVFGSPYNGTLDLNGRSQTIASVSGTGQVSLGSGTLTIGDATSTELQGYVNGNGTVIKQGSGWLYLDCVGYSATTTIVNAGKLSLHCSTSTTAVRLADVAGAIFEALPDATIGSLGGGGANGGTVNCQGTLRVGDETSTTFNGAISGDTFIKQGAGTLTLTASLAHLAYLGVSAGTLRLSGGDNSLSSSLDVCLTGGTLDISNQRETIGTLHSNRDYSGNIALGSGTLTVTQTTDIGFGGVISGSGGCLVKEGPKTLTLTAKSTYSGATVVNAGKLEIFPETPWAVDYLPATTSVTLANVVGAVLTFTDTHQTIASLSGGGSNGGNVTLTVSTLSVGNEDSTTYAGIISGSNGILVKQGAGTLTLGGANAYTGNTTINAGALALGIDNALPTGVAMILNGGTLVTDGFSQESALGALTLSSDSAIDLGTLGESILKFADSHSAKWAGELTIVNWNGSLDGGGADELFFGSSSSALSLGQLSDITFKNPNGLVGNYQATILATGEVVPIPEPTGLALLVGGSLLLGGIGAFRRFWQRI
jgi:fibronectin-binding autotransporter adhesin